jgi:hypothetical protein
MRKRSFTLFAAGGALLVALPLSGVGAAHATTAITTKAAPTVNWAIDGTATATTAESGYPAANAIDGDASTDWCTDGWTGTLTVDLGQARDLTDLGITLDNTSPSASATLEYASTAGDWQQAVALKDVALDAGNPMYFPLPKHVTARYLELTVYSDTGRGRDGLRRRPVVHPAGTRGWREVHLRREGRHPGKHHARGRRELRADAAMG